MISPRAKLSVGLSSNEWGNYKRTQQGALTTLLLYIYYYIVVHATIIYLPHVHPPCFLHVLWCHTFNLHCICAHHVYTMRNPCPLTSLLTLTPSRLFLILPDPKSFQTSLDSITWLPGHMPISCPFVRCRLIINYCPISVH